MQKEQSTVKIVLNMKRLDGQSDWCRSEWTKDGVVYEAEVLSVNRKKRTGKVTFVLFGNKEV